MLVAGRVSTIGACAAEREAVAIRASADSRMMRKGIVFLFMGFLRVKTGSGVEGGGCSVA
ncbi:MAG: hypothetical protein DRP64_03085 [Verrucomicrobia bacterium]|nr:MAG: hypothetical protein DRP64_03085 [Verrucomicrobiota bacterium]